MDFQICLDSYAVGFYVTDYFTKPDSGETKKLKEALKETKHMDDWERARYLAYIYFSSREICAAEAIYRLLRHLRLIGSDLTTTFVSADFPEERSSFLTKLNDDEEETYNALFS